MRYQLILIRKKGRRTVTARKCEITSPLCPHAQAHIHTCPQIYRDFSDTTTEAQPVHLPCLWW